MGKRLLLRNRSANDGRDTENSANWLPFPPAEFTLELGVVGKAADRILTTPSTRTKT
jgi:hypothetical protein